MNLLSQPLVLILEATTATIFLEPTWQCVTIWLSIVIQHTLIFQSQVLFIYKKKTGFRPRWRRRQTHCASSPNQKKDNNLKTKNNHSCQKIKLHGSSTTKEIKKKHSSRLVGGVEMGSQGREDSRQGGSWQTQ